MDKDSPWDRKESDMTQQIIFPDPALPQPDLMVRETILIPELLDQSILAIRDKGPLKSHFFKIQPTSSRHHPIPQEFDSQVISTVAHV